ncbi:hypothetical protein DAI22_11g105200 [Oryza sativa Japonica Group]|uniref:cDNA clone:J023069B08, full insert sequence n=2 Tax=Oryza TaxID=4527 RepID=B7EIL8_ORYSJ|nr:hypothetical protein DAI22_11g105200 [Oryza sativa Japonica Group]BAG92215.1 unnamed protein product [Oryza sativa Japonica Group]
MSSGSTHRGEEKEKNIRYPCCTNVGSIWVGHAKEDKLCEYFLVMKSGQPLINITLLVNSVFIVNK